MKIALIGGGGTGKTTLCNALSESLKIPVMNMSTSSMMPAGINSHHDVLKAGIDNPDWGIGFQSGLIEERHKYFNGISPHTTEFISDRTCLDSYIYYAIHNSMFDTDENAKRLLELSLANLNSFDHIILMEQSNVFELQGEDRRSVSSAYLDVFTTYLKKLIVKHRLPIISDTSLTSLELDAKVQRIMHLVTVL